MLSGVAFRPRTPDSTGSRDVSVTRCSPTGQTERQTELFERRGEAKRRKRTGEHSPRECVKSRSMSGRGPKAESRNREEKERDEISKRSRARRNTGNLVQEWMAARDGTAQPKRSRGCVQTRERPEPTGQTGSRHRSYRRARNSRVGNSHRARERHKGESGTV